MTINIRNTEFQLLPEKAIFLPLQEILIIADMHLGKLVHFRKKGIFVPTGDVNEDLELLKSLIEKHKPKEVVFLGDLFHSEINSEYKNFMKVVECFSSVKFTLTKGNHDIISKEFFQTGLQFNQVDVIDERFLENGIVLRHQLPKVAHEDCFYIIGHIHPGYLIQGRGRQTFRLPCFHQSRNVFILPAFGKHTGLFIMKLLEEDKIYVIMNEKVVQVR